MGPFSEPCPFGLTHLEFSGLHCCLFVKVRFLSLDRKLFRPVQTQLWYNIMSRILCQDFFKFFWISFQHPQKSVRTCRCCPHRFCFFAVDFYYSIKSKKLSTHNLKILCISCSHCITALTIQAKNLEVLRFQHFHLLYRQLNGERGIWTLAPRERPTPLAGAPLQPLEYFSIIWIASRYQYFVMSFSQRKSYYT